MPTRIENNATDTSCVNVSSIGKNMTTKELLIEQHGPIMIDEFLDQAEDIVMSSISVDVDYDGVEESGDRSRENEQRSEINPFSPIAIDEAVVQEIIDNDDRLHREVDEFMNMCSIAMDEDEEFDLNSFNFAAIMGSSAE